jgi:hypothetical protein
MMILDILPRMIEYPLGAQPQQADYNSFLAINGSFTFHRLLFWFLPIYLLIVSAEDVIEDYATGYRNILVTLKGKKKYLTENYLKSFIMSFLVIFLSLMFNLLLCHIIFYGATYFPFADLMVDFEKEHLFAKCVNHPTVANIAFILFTSFLSAVIGMTSTSLALSFHNRKAVYVASFVLWFIPLTFHKSIMLSIQPFSEYDLYQILPTYLFTIVLHLVVSLIMYIKEIKYEKI